MSIEPLPSLKPGAPLLVSPALVNGDSGDAYELKFVLPEAAAGEVEAWARRRLAPDPHGRNGTYSTTSLYCDTSGWDVYHRSAGYRRSKYRVRRYGAAPDVHLERKKKRGDKVRKHRDAL